MKVSDFKNLLDEVCVYTVDLYKKNNVFSPDFTLKRADASLIKQSKFWPDTTQEKDGYGGWDWDGIWWPSRYKKERFCIALCQGEVVSALFSGKVQNSSSEVRLEYIQRSASAGGVKGIVTPVAITFAAVLAHSLSVENVVVSNPAPLVVQHYVTHMRGSVSLSYQRQVVTAISVKAQDVISFL
ncbi:Uncharacterised protein [Serratia liquefaciens]|uniref:hypothetical protein n=1 Tax=Serratia liquefaciens TaxID=614 RepID=UPI00217B095C|nr:hypothetical protein [Serratia liquefaciens]CAI2015951.1 Uncharacterised protein [Serratia liquefaciens]